MSILADISLILNVLAMLLWFGLALWCSPALARVISGKAGPIDPLVALVGGLVFNFFWFALRPIVFGSHADVMSTAEVVWRAASFLFAILVGLTTVAVVRFYSGNR